jgi:3-oxoacyl-[acyl-carrier-protein] synthase-3
MIKNRIAGTGSYLPDKILTNEELSKQVDTSDEWIIARTGIKARRIAAPGEATSDMSLQAALRAIDNAGIDAAEIDLIIVATVTPDHQLPSTACLLQAGLGLNGCMAFDIQAACSGFIYALSLADRIMKTGGATCALVVGAETLSRITDWEDRTTCVLFGDGAGAAVLRPSPVGDRGILSTHCHADGRFKELLWIPAGGTRAPLDADNVGSSDRYVKMAGREVFKIAVNAMVEGANEALRANKMEGSDVDLFIPHQANARIVAAVKERFGFPEEKVFVNLDKVGNTSAASIPLALDEANRSGMIREGDVVLLDAFGGGLTWASALIRW